MVKANFCKGYIISLILLLIGLHMQLPSFSHAAESLCAEVKIEIKQELTLERQAFSAHMKINNGIAHISLEDVGVSVSFADEDGNPVTATSDPDDTSAAFYIRVDSIENINNIDGTGQVQPSSSADIYWLIIPSVGAANQSSNGTLYYVGATLTYSIGGETHTTVVTPDYIYVKPLPELSLDYFLTQEVYSDDAFTPETEPAEPFSLGVRVKNDGFGTAKALKIDSAQPKIVSNEQGLLIGFVIEGSEVNGQAATSSLLVDFGDIAPGGFGTARWIMTCTLSGEFTEFDANISHSDELGGELTSLIQQEDVKTHFLVQDVLVDLNGRDNIRDFLALKEKVDNAYWVFESEGTDTQVTDHSSLASLTGPTGSDYTLSLPVTAGFAYVKLSDPNNGQMSIKEAVRSDGKQIKTQNVWISKNRKANPADGWDYYFNLLDVNTTGSYTITFENIGPVAAPPVLQTIANVISVENQVISFAATATDSNGTIPVLSATPLPVGTTFIDNHDGTGSFTWTPFVGQAGLYGITFKASDGALKDSQYMSIIVCPADDTDCDNLPDSWEMDKFGTLDRDGTGDFDNDGISDLDEYLAGSDPTVEDNAPSAPVILSPVDLDEETILTPDFVIENSTDPDGHTVSYQFEVYSDQALTVLVASDLNVAETIDTTAWTLPGALEDNTWYYWRVRATDTIAYSVWVYGSFFVNTANDAPGVFSIDYPADTTQADTLLPVLGVTNSQDPDKDTVTYGFELYSDSSLTTLVTSVIDIAQGLNGSTSWTVDTTLLDTTTYYWKAIATDEDGLQTETLVAEFTVNTANSAPSAPAISAPSDNSEVISVDIDLTVINATDANSDPLTYMLELDIIDTFDSPALQSSGEISEGMATTTWSITGLDDNTLYFWRAKASDSLADSPWTMGRFFVNTANDVPLVPIAKNPGENAWVGTFTPIISIAPGTDQDNDILTYTFQVYADESLTTLVEEGTSSTLEYTTATLLDDKTRYFWRAHVEDEHGLTGEPMDAISFFVKRSVNEPPQITLTEPSVDLITNAASLLIQWTDEDADSNATISLFHDTDATGLDGTLIADSILEDPDNVDDAYTWDISGLEGIYYIYVVISDEEFSVSSYATGSITIDRTPPVVTADPVGGTMDMPVSITLSVDETADIYYTMDSTDPTIGSLVYSATIELLDTTTLKFMAVDTAGNQSQVQTEVYTVPQDLTVTIETDDGTPLSSLSVYAFTESGSYTGKSAVTDGNGMAVFYPNDFTPGSYKFRIDYMANQFWTAPDAVPDTLIFSRIIETEAVEVDVTTAAGIAQGITVYLFSSSGAYLGINQVTDVDGKVYFELPVGVSYQFRADILGSQYWSNITPITGGSTNNIGVSAGGGLFQITVQEDASTPMQSITVYLFSASGSYLSMNMITDASGSAQFNLPEGTYKVRANYLGYQFWSNDTHVSADISIDLTIFHHDITITVDGIFQGQTPIEDVPVYLFTSSGSYMSQNPTTDTSGQVQFHLPEQNYKVRANYMSQQFWSPEFNAANADVEIPLADAQVTVGWSSAILPDVPVYAYTASGTYLSLTDTTDASGQVTFRAPAAGTYKFRADYQSSQYWSTDQTLTAEVINPVDISTGGGTFAFTVKKDPTTPLEGVMCYVFSEAGVYFGEYGPTSSNGEVSFDLADGNYNIRVDYMGYQFWSNLYDVPTTLSDAFIIPHQDITVTVSGIYQGSTPLENIPVYLFTSGGSYLNLTQATDVNGQVSFYLPDQDYTVRANYLNWEYWSAIFNSTDIDVDIPMADAEIWVTGSGLPLEGMPVYVFTTSGAYQNITDTTDASGQVTFRLPAEDFKFRTDYQSSQFWSNDTTLTAEQVNSVDISCGGGEFNLTVRKSGTEFLQGVSCYVFDESNAYLNMSATTSSEGLVTFNLSDGNYKIRVDYMGYQFWTSLYAVPGTLSDVFTIVHQDVTITVDSIFQGSADPMEGLTVYLFTEAGSYMSQNPATDANGQVVFNLPAQAYKVRAAYLNQQFWSFGFTQQDTTVNIPMADAEITVTGAGQALEGQTVYVYSQSGTYLNITGITDTSGQVTFRLPTGDYKFRSDYQNSQYWSYDATLIADQVNSVEINTGGGVFTLTVLKNAVDPLVSTNCYVFSEAGSYLGMSGATDASGQISFNLADGTYKIRVDHMGYQFWTGVYEVPTTLADDFMVSHQDVTVTVEGFYQTATPLSGVPTYLFTSSGSYMSQTQTTDVSGQVAFNLPDQEYKVRANYLGNQFWSNVFQFADATITINQGMAEVHVHRSGVDVPGATVYLYTEGGAYQNWNETTDALGKAEFLLPDVNYKFRADEGGDQVYSTVITILPGQVNSIEINLD